MEGEVNIMKTKREKRNEDTGRNGEGNETPGGLRNVKEDALLSNSKQRICQEYTEMTILMK